MAGRWLVARHEEKADCRPWKESVIPGLATSGQPPYAPGRRVRVAAVLTFSPTGELLKTEQAAQAGGDGLVIMPDGTKYVSSVAQGGVLRIRADEPAELIARNIPSAASMCYDAGANHLVIPMNPNNGLAFVPIP